MNRNLALSAALALSLSAACATSSADPAPAIEPDAPFASFSVTAEIVGVEGAAVGQLMARSAPDGVILRAELDKGALSPGWHGLHLHQVPDCSDTGVFKLSGGHVGKVEGGHGLMNPDGPEGGDLPNIHAAEDGSAAAEMFSPRIDLEELMEAGGFAMIIHQNADDHITQPIGGAGPRVACAAVTG